MYMGPYLQGKRGKDPYILSFCLVLSRSLTLKLLYVWYILFIFVMDTSLLEWFHVHISQTLIYICKFSWRGCWLSLLYLFNSSRQWFSNYIQHYLQKFTPTLISEKNTEWKWTITSYHNFLKSCSNTNGTLPKNYTKKIQLQIKINNA